MSKKIHINKPRPLVESSKIGPLLKEALPVSFDEKRLAENRAVLMTRLSVMSAEKNRRYRNVFFPQHRLAWAVFAMLLLMSAGAAAVIYWRNFITPLSTENSGEEQPLSEPLKLPEEKIPNPVSRLAVPMHVADEQADTTAADAGPAFDVAQRGKTGRSVNGVSPLDSTFNEQVKLFNRAKAYSASGDFSAAQETLKRLNSRFPTGPLSLESNELSAHVSAGLHRYQEASQIVKSLIAGRMPTRKKAQLYRFLGDLQVKQNDCDHAVESYRRALGLGASGEESEAAKAGIRNCLH